MGRLRRVFLHPAWLAPVLVLFFIAGAGLGAHVGGNQAASTETRRVTSVSTFDEVLPAETITVTHTRLAQPKSTNLVITASGTLTSAVKVRYGRWYGKLRGTHVALST